MEFLKSDPFCHYLTKWLYGKRCINIFLNKIFTKMYWSQKYAPRCLQELTYNKTAAQYLQKMIDMNEFMHFVLCGSPGSGKRTLVKLFLNEVTTQNDIMWINQSCLKTIESRDKLYTFINSKSSIGKKKWLIVENLNKMVVNFSNILFNILSSDDILLCVLETEITKQITPWCVIFNTYNHTDIELIEAGKKIISKEKISNHDNKKISECAAKSEHNILTFLFLLQVYFEKNVNLVEYILPEFSSKLLLFNPSLKLRLCKLMNYEINGYSHLDIAITLYNYVYEESKHIEIATELGNAVEYLTNYEQDCYFLYGTICRIWEFTSNNVKY